MQLLEQYDNQACAVHLSQEATKIVKGWRSDWPVVSLQVCPDISREEIVNACGIDDFHDGVNYTRTACVIAVSKARDMFEPFLHQVSP